MRLVLDTNVVVSGLLSVNGPPGKILNHLLHGRVVAVYSRPILDEYATVLARRKFSFDPEDIDSLIELIVTEGWAVLRIPRLSVECSDPKDQPFYDCAAAVSCPLVNGNLKHFPKGGPVEVLSPARAIERL
ncbi:MAG: putative toxin-antitoxin system toxin component, PIN family [Gammaproteobacteria bacterium]|nr:putative toxin-antitoxin system toxin component, PIN family [Gammaproteobacteria bacterium]